MLYILYVIYIICYIYYIYYIYYILYIIYYILYIYYIYYIYYPPDRVLIIFAGKLASWLILHCHSNKHVTNCAMNILSL